jgi:hypothetical protein
VEFGIGSEKRRMKHSTMADEKKTDDLEKLLSDEKSLEGREKALIDDLLKQRAAAIANFDEKLAKLGYPANSDKLKRSHHKRPSSAGGATEKPKAPKTPPAEGSGKVHSPTVPRQKR